jgi:hypothetical protein
VSAELSNIPAVSLLQARCSDYGVASQSKTNLSLSPKKTRGDPCGACDAKKSYPQLWWVIAAGDLVLRGPPSPLDRRQHCSTRDSGGLLSAIVRIRSPGRPVAPFAARMARPLPQKAPARLRRGPPLAPDFETRPAWYLVGSTRL